MGKIYIGKFAGERWIINEFRKMMFVHGNNFRWIHVVCCLFAVWRVGPSRFVCSARRCIKLKGTFGRMSPCFCAALLLTFLRLFFLFFCILLILFYLSGGIRCSYHCVCSVCLWLLAFYWNKKPLNLARSWSSSVNLLSRFTEMYEETWPIFRVCPLPTNTFCFRIKYDTPGVYYFSEETRFKIDQPG